METNANQSSIELDLLFLANLLDGRESMQRVQRRSPHGEALRRAAESYVNRDYVAAYESFQPACDKIVADMQRVLSRGLDDEVNKLVRERRKPVAEAKRLVEKKRDHAQHVIDLFHKLRRDLEHKPLVRLHLKGQQETSGEPADDRSTTDRLPIAAPSTILKSTAETRVDPPQRPEQPIQLGGRRYHRAAYSPPSKHSIYCVRDKAQAERFIRVIDLSADGAQLDVEVLSSDGLPRQTLRLAADSLARQAAAGWCQLLRPIADPAPLPTKVKPSTAANSLAASPPAADAEPIASTLRVDIQNFSRCCADIARAGIKFDTQLIKDIGDGPFRAGNYDQAFRNFEQAAVGFTSAVASSRRSIAEGRRRLNQEKGKLSGKEIQERTAAFVRNEQQIHTAEREFSTILEGLRMFLRARQA